MDFWGAMASCLPSAPLTKREHSRLALVSTFAMLGAEACKVKSSAYDVMSVSGIGQPETKWLKRAGEMTDPVRPPPAPGGKASGAVGKSTTPFCRAGMPRAI